METYLLFTRLDGGLDKLAGAYLRATSAERAEALRKAVLEYKAGMVAVLSAGNEEERAQALERMEAVGDGIEAEDGLRPGG